MIGKIRKGSSFGGLARYLFGPGKREEHVDPQVVAGGNVLLGDPRMWRDWVADMRLCAGQRPEIVRPVWHCSLRTAPEDPILDDARWAAVAAQHIEAMGLADYPWVAVRHGLDHVHLVACRVDVHGRVWRDSHDYARSMRSCRQIERDHGLTVLTRDRAASRLAATTAAERARAQRRGVDPERARLREAMHAAQAAAVGAGVAGWERELAAYGVLYEAKTTRDGTVIGYRVSLPGWTDPTGGQVWLKASQVDRALSWNRVRAGLGDPASGRPPAGNGAGLRSTAAQVAAQAFATPPGPGRRWAGTPTRREGSTAARLAALDRPPRHRSPRASPVMPLHVMARLVAAAKASNPDRNTAAALCLVYALAAFADAVVDLRQAHDRLHQARAARTAAPPLRAWPPPGTTSTPPRRAAR